MMSDYSESVSIMFPASWPVDKPDAHCTIIYLGEKSELPVDKDILEAVVARLGFSDPGPVPVTGLALFGPERNVLVATLDPEKLQPIRDSFERTLAKVGVENASEYKTYRPHVTIQEGYDGHLADAMSSLFIPKTIGLEAPQLWWGDEH